MTAATTDRNVTQQLDALFDQVGVEALSLNFAKALAEAEGLNTTSACIRFYRWRAERLEPQEQQPA
ncbi:hypothetical protein [Diaphorobacter sp.]|uniref:hypothetical protein n=1 Tax=Diaphorobacter sp. TaxID=1934310 RepID=UPI00258AB669|nr:hypothetical protein [Diaphorobacter sp.]